jgi:hypothetical protein
MSRPSLEAAESARSTALQGIDLLILGCPKSATTTFWSLLSARDDVQPAFMGESQFLWPAGTSPRYPDESRSPNTWMRPPVAKGAARYLLDKSVWNLYAPQGEKALGGVAGRKALVFLRQPAELLFSLHGQARKQARDRRRHFHDVVNACDRAGWQPNADPAADPYCLAMQIKQNVLRWQAALGRDLAVVRAGAAGADAPRLYRDICAWLSLPPDQPRFATHNQARVPRFSFVTRWTRKPPGLVRVVGQALLRDADRRQRLRKRVASWNLVARQDRLHRAERVRVESALAEQVDFVAEADRHLTRATILGSWADRA